MSTRITFLHVTIFPVVLILCLLSSPTFAQDDDSYLLKWSPETGRSYTYRVSTTGLLGDNYVGTAENFTIQFDSFDGGLYQVIAEGETVPDGARLGIRFQRSYWPDFPYTIDELGHTDVATGQPFPVFYNIPILPDGPVVEGTTWSGGPIGILPDPNVAAIPFTFDSTVTSISNYDGELCALIETTYEVALDDGAQSFMPFLGLVQGDPPSESEQAGQGAPIGGVVEDSRAHEAGIEPGDLIIEAEGQRIRAWGGLEEILPQLVPEVSLVLVVLRGEEEIDIEIAPEGVPLAWIAGTGGLRSTCYFSIERGIPLKTDLTSENLVFVLTNAEGVEIERDVSLHIVMEYLYGGR